jgi:hypothetical protein
MTISSDRTSLEAQIAHWREYLRRRPAIHGPDVEELEGHLRDQVAVLTEAGLAGDEAFLVAVKRMGSLDALSREFAREHSERLWKQLVIAPDAADEPANTGRSEILVVLGLAVAAALAIKLPALFGLRLSPDEEVLGPWLIPCGATGAVIIGSWLVEAKQSVIENMAPVLTRLFTPLFTILLLAFLATMAWTGNPINVEREVLIGFDLLLVVVVGLVLYAASARDPQAPPDLFDGLQLLLVVSALAVDGVALAAIAARISEFGFTPNRVAALGENLILLVNLSWSAWLYACFLRHRGSFI